MRIGRHIIGPSRIAARTVVVALACVLFSACGSLRPDLPPTTIRVMTWNIHHGEGTDGAIDVQRIAKLILSQKVDVVALQEIDRGVPRSKNLDIITALADETDRTYAFGKTIDYQGGEYGNGFLTRFPILEERNIRYKESQGREQRAVLVLVLEYRGQEFVVANTHLDSQRDDSARVMALRELKQTLSRYSSRPILLCGDMNDEPGSRSILEIGETMDDTWTLVGQGDGFTFPSTSPRKRIDYVFKSKEVKPDSLSTPAGLTPTKALVVSTDASDHRPLIVEFTLPSEH